MKKNWEKNTLQRKWALVKQFWTSQKEKCAEKSYLQHGNDEIIYLYDKNMNFNDFFLKKKR